MKRVSESQIRVLCYLEEYRQHYYCSPTYREISGHFGWASPQASLGHLRSLERKGCVIPIVAANGARRGYRLSPQGQELIQEPSAGEGEFALRTKAS